MAGAKVANDKTEQEVPPNEAGREVLSYVQREEAEADAIFNEANGIEEDPEKKEAGDDKESDKEAEKEAEDKESEKTDDKEPKDKEPEAKDKTVEDDDGERRQARSGQPRSLVLNP